MDDFVVHCELTASVVDNQYPHAPAAVGEGLVESRPQSTLVNDGKTLFDVASLGHSDDTAVVTDIKDAVLLEDGAQHVLNDDRRRRVRHKTRLFMELLGEEINAEVAVLAGLSRSGDTDDLAGTALENQKVADADVVARDSDGMGSSAALDIADALTHTIADASWATIFLIDNHFLPLYTVTMGVEGVEDTISSFLEPVAEGVIAAFVVVVAHFRWWINGGFGFNFYFSFFTRIGATTFVFNFSFFTRIGAATFVFNVVGWLDASAIVAFGNVDFLFTARSFDLDFGVSGALIAWLPIAKTT